jgi:hypothetical protein
MSEPMIVFNHPPPRRRHRRFGHICTILSIIWRLAFPSQPQDAQGKPLPNDTLRVFTTRPDTVFGVTFIAVAAEHRLALPGYLCLLICKISFFWIGERAFIGRCDVKCMRLMANIDKWDWFPNRGCPAADTPRVRDYVRKVFQMDDITRMAADQPKTGMYSFNVLGKRTVSHFCVR